MEFIKTKESRRGQGGGAGVADFFEEYKEDFDATREDREVALLAKIAMLCINDLMGQGDEALD